MIRERWESCFEPLQQDEGGEGHGLVELRAVECVGNEMRQLM